MVISAKGKIMLSISQNWIENRINDIIDERPLQKVFLRQILGTREIKRCLLLWYKSATVCTVWREERQNMALMKDLCWAGVFRGHCAMAIPGRGLIIKDYGDECKCT